MEALGFDPSRMCSEIGLGILTKGAEEEQYQREARTGQKGMGA